MHLFLITMRTHTKFRSLNPARAVHYFRARSVVKACAPADDDISAAIAIQRSGKWYARLRPAVHFATNGNIFAPNQRAGRVIFTIGPTAFEPRNPSIPVIWCDRIKLSTERPNVVGIEGHTCRGGWVGDDQWVTRTDDVRVARDKLKGDGFCGSE